MGNLIRMVGTSNAVLPNIHKGVGVLSDGSVVAIVPDVNQSGVSDDGGDNSGVPKLYLYHSTDRINWTLKATLSLSGIVTGVFFGSMVVDSANNIHLAYRWTANSARYVQFTYSAGPSWLVGAPVDLPAEAGYQAMSHVDIDTVGESTSALVVGTFVYSKVSGAKKTGFKAYVRTVSGSWVAHNALTVINGDSHLPWSDDISVAGDTTPIGGDNLGVFAVTATRRGNATDFGDMVYCIRYNASTGTRLGVDNVQGGIYKGLGGGFRKYTISCTQDGVFSVAGTVSQSPWMLAFYKFKWDRTTGSAVSLTPVATSGSLGITTTRTSLTHSWQSVAYMGVGSDETERFMIFGKYSGMVVNAMIETNGSVIGFPTSWVSWDDRYAYSGGYWSPAFGGRYMSRPVSTPIDCFWAGGVRNVTPERVDLVTYATFNGSLFPVMYRAESVSKLLPNAPTSVKPADSATVSTDRPVLYGNHELQTYYPQMKTRLQWQVATDAGFTTNLRTIVEPASDFRYANGTPDPFNSTAIASEAVPAASELFQGTWYVRALVQDQSGSKGPWSTASSFVVSHPPAAVNLYPTGGSVFGYGGSGNATFTWSFSDPSPFDNQTAYQIVVEDADTGSVILDSGKVSSTQQMATLAIPLSGKDIDLRWKLKLWDSDDVGGSYSQYNMFYLADAPTPSVTSPVDGSTISTAVPEVTWDSGLSGTREQVEYRVRVTQGLAEVYSSDWVSSPTLTHTIPVGYLTNNQDYTITVTIRDNRGLEGSASASISTSWTPPDGPAAWNVYIHEYATRGFVYITWNNASQDADFSGWNVYRRKVGDASWSLLETYTQGYERYAHRDYTAGSSQAYDYVVTQLVDRFGDIVESPISSSVRVAPFSDNYWLVDELSSDFKALPLFNVTADPFAEEYEQETFTVIGRGRRKEYGDRLGYAGTITSQIRDKQISATARSNYGLNPSMQVLDDTLLAPKYWEVLSGGQRGTVSTDFVDTITPPPFDGTPFRVVADALGASSSDFTSLRQTLSGVDFPADLAVTSRKVYISVWVSNVEENASNVAYRMTAEWRIGDTPYSTTNSGQINPAVNAVETYIQPTDDDGLAGNPTRRWYRIQVVTQVPDAPVDGLRIRIRIEGNDTGSGTSIAQLVAGGFQIETDRRTSYFDGNTLGAEWLGPANESQSTSTGFYTARSQRLKLEALKARRASVYLRNPFGDVWRVATGNVSANRIPGVGRSEFVDVQIPYEEVDF